MKSLFNKPVNRKKTGSIKWDKQTNTAALPFWMADADYQTAPVILESLVKRVKMGHFGYTYERPEYFQSIINWYALRYHVAVKEKWIIPVPGVVLALKLAVEAFTAPHHQIVIQTPVYHQFFRVIKDCSRTIVENKLINRAERYEIDFLDLEEKFKAGATMLIFCNPHNPVGRVWTKAELTQVVNLCESYGVYLVSDEIHSDFIMPNGQFTSLQALPYQKLITCSAPSKTFNLAGLVSSYVIISDSKVFELYERQKAQQFTPHVNIFAIEATIAGYFYGAPWVDAQNEHIYENYQLLLNFLTVEFPQVRISALEGTYLAWLNFTYLGKTSQELVDELANAGISVSSGSTFGLGYEGYLRFNLACTRSQLKAGLKILKRWK